VVELLRSRRDNFTGKMPNNTAAFIFAGNSRAMTQDEDYPFLVDRNFFYLTGLTGEEMVLVIVKSSNDVSMSLYVLPRDDHEERWHGKRADHSEISDICGIPVSSIFDLDRFDEDSYEIIRTPHLNVAVDGSSVMDAPRKFRDRVAGIRANADIIDLKDIFMSLRMIKSEEEQECIRCAAKITEDSIEAIKSFIKPGVTEYELHTRLEFEMKMRGSEVFAFATIISSGKNAFYLHHGIPEKTGDGVIADGGFVQFDVGARYKGYCSDISRVFFVGYGDGEDDKRIILLDLIRDLRKACWDNIRPGMTFNNLNRLMHEMTYDFLIRNGFASEEEDTAVAAHRYYWHNTSHYLGLDVHDMSNVLPKDYRDIPFEEGVCLAVEPGVYIPEWNVGFRIEDDVAVTGDGCILLSSGNKGDIPEVIFC